MLLRPPCSQFATIVNGPVVARRVFYVALPSVEHRSFAVKLLGHFISCRDLVTCVILSFNEQRRTWLFVFFLLPNSFVCRPYRRSRNLPILPSCNPFVLNHPISLLLALHTLAPLSPVAATGSKNTSPLRAVAILPLSDFHELSRAVSPKGTLTRIRGSREAASSLTQRNLFQFGTDA